MASIYVPTKMEVHVELENGDRVALGIPRFGIRHFDDMGKEAAPSFGRYTVETGVILEAGCGPTKSGAELGNIPVSQIRKLIFP